MMTENFKSVIRSLKRVGLDGEYCLSAIQD